MPTTTNIKQAINAQMNYVEHVRRILQPLPGNIHRLVDTDTHPDIVYESAERHIRNSAKAGQPLIARGVLNSAIRLYMSIKNSGTSKMDGFTPNVFTEIDNSPTDAASAYSAAVTHVFLQAQAMSGEATYITSEIVDLLTSAASTLEPEAITSQDLFAPNGFCYLEKPLIVGDYDPETGEWTEEVQLGWRAFSWQTNSSSGKPGITFSIYTDNACMRYLFYPSLGTLFDIDVTEPIAAISDRPINELILCDITHWDLDTPWADAGQSNASVCADALLGSSEGPIPIAMHIAFFRRFFLSMMRFCWQQLLVQEPATVERSLRRSAVRHLGQRSMINVLRLPRSRHSSTSTGEGSRLDYRLLVRGHWRNQHYPSLGPARTEDGYNASSHRRIWIDPHVKGPDDAPFVAKKKVTLLSR